MHTDIVLFLFGIALAIIIFISEKKMKTFPRYAEFAGYYVASICIIFAGLLLGKAFNLLPIILTCVIVSLIILFLYFQKNNPWKQLASWLFWKRYSPNLSYIEAKVDSFDAHGFPGFSAKFSLTITNKRKPLKIDLTGVCIVVIQKGSNSIGIGNSGLGTEDLLPNKPKTWKDIKVVTSPPQLVGVISNPPDISKPYAISIRGIYVTYNKFKKELSTLQNVKSPKVK